MATLIHTTANARFLLVAVLLAAFLTAQAAAQIETEPLVGTVVDADGKPVVGARVEAWRRDGRGFVGLDLVHRDEAKRVAVAPTDKQGRFAMQAPLGHVYELRIDQAPHARWVGSQSLAPAELRIRLQPGATFTATLKGPDGKPATGRVRAWFRDTDLEAWDGRTDDAGAFRCDRVRPGDVRVEVLPDAAPSPPWSDITLVAGGTTAWDVQLTRGVRLQGRVVDATTGTAIEGASIGEGWSLRRRVTTDRSGGYELPGYGSRGAADVHCQANGFVEQIVPDPGTAADPLTLDFRMERGLAAAGRIVDPDGKPVAGIYVRAFGTHHDGKDQVHDCIAARTTADGTFRLAGLRPSLEHVLVVRGDGWATAVYALPDADATQTKQAGDVPLQRPNLVRGTLLGADGKPRPNAKVMIWGYNGDRTRLAPRGKLARSGSTRATHAPDSWGLLDMYVAGHETTTNADGGFAFGALPSGSFRLIAYAENNTRIFVGEPFEVPAGSTKPFELNANR